MTRQKAAMRPATPDQRTVIVLREYERREVMLDAEVAARIHAGGHARVSPAGDGRYEVRASASVGVIAYGDLELRIVPKVSIGRLLFLAAHGRLDEKWRDLDAQLSAAADPLSELARVLTWLVDRALRPTPLQGYRTEESAQKHLRGRIVFDRQIASRAGVAIPVELRFDEYDLDIVENRVLLAALVAVEAVSMEPTVQRSLAHLRFMLDGVTAWPSGVPVPEIPWTRLNLRYRPAVQLARLILDRRSVEFGTGGVAGRGFMIEMPSVFERFLEVALGAELELSGGTVRAQRTTMLDEQDNITMFPDLTWWSGGACRAVIDAKYKRVRKADYPNADAYQMLAYCTALGLSEGWLVYADLDGGEPLSHSIRQAGVTIRVESIDLGGEIETVDASVARLASRIRSSSVVV